jgi:putative ABC transport system ATP-binding protein
MLEVKHIVKRFWSGRGRVLALDRISFRAEPGRPTAVAGRSGSGKTTLLHCIAGLEEPDEGRVVCHGREITRLPSRARQALLRTDIGIVFQFGNLLSYLTVNDNIAFPLRLGGWPRSAVRRRVDELLQRIDLPRAGKALPGELSGGELQRVSVARAIAHRPRLVLADEPTASLDTVTAAALIDLLTVFCREDGTILLMATHDTAVMHAAATTLVLQDGRVDAPQSGGCQ